MSARPTTSERVVEALRREPGLDELHKARLERRLLASVAAPSPARRPAAASRIRLAAAGGLTLLAAAAAVLLWTGRESEAPRYALASAGGVDATGAVSAGTELALAAGESADVRLFDLAVSVRERSHLRVEAVSVADVRLALTAGEARFAFHPRDRGHQHVAIRTPSARIEIVGTELTVRASEAGTEVLVHEGVVRVIPARGDAVLVRAGQSWGEAPLPPGEGPPAGEAARAADPVDGARAADLPEPPEGAGGVEPPGAEAAGLDEAVPDEAVPDEAVPDEGASEAALAGAPRRSAAERLARAETLTGAAAERLLLGLVDDPGASREERAEAWALLGDLRRDRPERALEAFARAERLARGALRANAIYEQARLLDRGLRDAARARAEYERYLAEFPAGPNAAAARARLGALAE
jgi:ferric-dicitrate binding protein FerR (iron transport regulator)